MDDITPRLVRKARPARQLTGQAMRRGMDGIRAVPRTPITVPPLRTEAAPLVPTRFEGTGQRLRQYLERVGWLQYPLIGIVALAMAYNATIGQWLVGIYAVAALVLRVDSQQPFIGALILLVAIPVFQVIGLTGVSQNAAIYAYELLVVGVIVAIIEISQKSA